MQDIFGGEYDARRQTITPFIVHGEIENDPCQRGSRRIRGLDAVSRTVEDPGVIDKVGRVGGVPPQRLLATQAVLDIRPNSHAASGGCGSFQVAPTLDAGDPGKRERVPQDVAHPDLVSRHRAHRGL